MIEIKDLKVSYGNKDVLQIDSLNFEAGKISVILGLNGSGKSTLLKALVGIKNYEGTVLLGGKDASKMSHKKKAAFVSYLPQFMPPANLDVYTLVCHGRFPYLGYSKILGQKDLELVEEALRLTDLWDLREKGLGEISGGERQRAYLAMVIAQNTPFILLDEPATYMDIKHQLEVMELLKKLSGQGRGIIFSSHDLPQSFSTADSIFLLKEGRFVESGSPEKIAENSERLRDAMGIGIKKVSDKDSVYKYGVCK